MTEPSALAAKSEQSWSLSFPCLAAEESGKAEGRAYGQAEAMARGLARLLRRQAKQKFGGENPVAGATLEQLADGFCPRGSRALGRAHPGVFQLG